MYENMAQAQGTQTLTTVASDQEPSPEPCYEQPPNSYAVPYGHTDDNMWRSLPRIDDLEGNEDAEMWVVLLQLTEIYRTALSASRHNSHYFSNQDLFGDSGYQHLRYAKYSELTINTERTFPSLRVDHLSFALDSRSRFDKACLRLPSRVPVLQEISFSLQCGDIMALLYTNDYEMKCFLRLIAGIHRESGKIRGNFLINGHKLKDLQLEQRIAHLREESSLLPNLTVLQYLHIHMGFRPPPRGRYPKVEIVLSSLALFPLKNKLCSALGRAEKVRVRLAAQVLRETDILLCENMTKDMDVYDTAFTIDYLRSWALKTGRVVILAIQPSSLDMLHMFSKTLLLSSGRVTYFGKSEEMIPYFESIQFPCPMFRNPCDYYVDLATHDHLSEEASRESLRRISCLCTHWAQRQKPLPSPALSQQAPAAPSCGIFKATLVLFKSCWLETVNNPFPVVKEACLTLLVSLFLCLLYPAFPENRRTTADDREGLVASLVYFSLIPLSCFWVRQAHHEKEHLLRGREDGFYGSVVFLTVVMVFNTTVTFLCSLLLYLPIFLLTEFTFSPYDVSRLLSFYLPLVVFYSLVRQLSLFSSFFFQSAKSSLLFIYLVLTLLFLLSGLALSMDDQPRIFNLLAILSPSYWVSEILLQQQFLNYSLFATVVDLPQGLSDLLVGCERRQILKKKIGDVPIFGVTHCTKVKGSQLLHFFGYQSSPLSFTSIAAAFCVILIWTAVAVFLTCCVAPSMRTEKNKKE